MTRYEEIQALFELSNYMRGNPPNMNIDENYVEAQKLDQELGNEFRPAIDQWNEGLISTVDLITWIGTLAFADVK